MEKTDRQLVKVILWENGDGFWNDMYLETLLDSWDEVDPIKRKQTNETVAQFMANQNNSGLFDEMVSILNDQGYDLKLVKKEEAEPYKLRYVFDDRDQEVYKRYLKEQG